MSYFLPIATQGFLTPPTDKSPSPQRSAAHAPLLGTSPPLPEPTCPSRGQVGSLCVSRPYAELPRFVLSGCCVGPPYGRGTACGATYSVEGVEGQGWPKTRVCPRNPYMDGCLSYRSTRGTCARASRSSSSAPRAQYRKRRRCGADATTDSNPTNDSWTRRAPTRTPPPTGIPPTRTAWRTPLTTTDSTIHDLPCTWTRLRHHAQAICT